MVIKINTESKKVSQVGQTPTIEEVVYLSEAFDMVITGCVAEITAKNYIGNFKPRPLPGNA